MRSRFAIERIEQLDGAFVAAIRPAVARQIDRVDPHREELYIETTLARVYDVDPEELDGLLYPED